MRELVLAILLALVVPAGDVRRGDVFDITLQSSEAVTLHIDERFTILAAPGATPVGVGALSYAGSATTRYVRLQVRADTAPGLAWVWASGERRAIRICCPITPDPKFHLYLPLARKSS